MFPNLAGTYNLEVGVTNPAADSLVDGFPAILILNAPSASGDFTGVFEIIDTRSYVAGREDTAGTLTFSNFGGTGPSAIPPLENDAWLTSLLSSCEWSAATEGSMTGSAVSLHPGGPVEVTFAGRVDVPCPSSQDASTLVPSVITVGGQQSNPAVDFVQRPVVHAAERYDRTWPDPTH